MATDVVLVNVPWAEYTRPSMQLGLIQALVQRAGLSCHTDHAVLRFVERVGPPLYREGEDFHRPHAEWVFTAAAFGQSGEDRLFDRLRHRGAAGTISALRALRAAAAPFIAETVEAVLRHDPKVVGFTTAMLQTTASAAVARALKAAAPGVRIVFGGAHCEGDTGPALMRAFPVVDVAVTGQCDAWVGDLFARIADGRSLEGIRGIIWRDPETLHVEAPAPRFDALDDNPVPAFADYFEQLEHSPLAASFTRSVPFEGSRGCWWGERRHCRFCGLNGTVMTYRSRTAAGLVDELAAQRRRFGVDTFVAVDEIIPRRYFHDLPPLLRRDLPGAAIFYEMSPSVARHLLEPLARACTLHSQPGIEHLSTRSLQLMNKGVRAADGVALLRRAEEFGMALLWNLIFGTPGETRADYAQLLAAMPALHHLTPPNLLPLTLARYSPFHNDPAAFGIRPLGPQRDLDLAYPVADSDLAALALNFEFAVADAEETPLAPLTAAVERWTRAKESGAALKARRVGSAIQIEDRRGCRRTHHLAGAAAMLYRYCEAPVTAEMLAERLRRSDRQAYFMCGGVKGIHGLLQQFARSGLVWQDEARFVALAVPHGAGFWLGLREAGAHAPPDAALSAAE